MSSQKVRPKTLRRAVHETLQSYGVSAILAVILIFLIPWWLRWCLFYLGSIVFLAFVIAPFVNDWRPRARVPVEGKAVFISGRGELHRFLKPLHTAGISGDSRSIFTFSGDNAIQYMSVSPECTVEFFEHTGLKISTSRSSLDPEEYFEAVMMIPRGEEYFAFVLKYFKSDAISAMEIRDQSSRSCDSGFGNGLAQKLDDLGLHVFAGCLFPEGKGAEALKKSASDRLHIVPLDVTSEESVKEALKYVKDNLKENKLWAVVNNAGLNEGAELMWTDMEVIKKVLEVNTFGVVRVTKAFLPLLCKSKGRVVAVASAAGRYTYPGMVPYCMSKQATVSFCDGLRLEMYRFGVKAITIEPWMYKTPITNEDTIVKYITKTWEDAPQEIKEYFPNDYLKRYLKSTMKFITFSISDKPQQVVDCLEEAVMAINPKYFYNPGTLFSRFTFWFISRVPKPIADLVLYDHCATEID